MRRVRSLPSPPRPRTRDDGSGNAPPLLPRLLQEGLGLREFGPARAVGEFEQLAIVAARGGRVAGGGRRSRRAGVTSQPVLRAAQRRFEGRERLVRSPQLQ